MKFRIFTGVIVLTSVASPVQLAAQEPQSNNRPRYTLMSLGSLGGTASGASSINNRNWVSGFSNLSGDSTQHAVLWAHGETVDLGTLGGPNSSVAWPNHNDHFVVGIAETPNLDPLGERWSCAAFFPSATGHTCLGFVWEDGVMRPLPTLGGNNGYAAGANRWGQTVGWAETTVHDPTCVAPQVLQFEAVIWGPEEEIQQLPPLPGDPDSAATAINDRGQVVGISGTCYKAVGASSAKHAVLWENGRAIDIGNLGGIAWNTPAAINNRGEVAGFSDLPGDDPDHPNFHAFRWTRRAGIEDLGTLPGDRLSLAYGINEGGQVVGQSVGRGGSRAFLWESGVMVDLNALVPPGSPLLIYANDINEAGRIVGQAYDQATGEFFSFVAVPTLNEDDD
jgi:probable HAF family extracellular repeat protein